MYQIGALIMGLGFVYGPEGESVISAHSTDEAIRGQTRADGK